MKKYFVLLAVLFQLNCYSQAPLLQWQKKFGGTIQDYGNCITRTIDGGYILVGDALSTDGDFSASVGISANAQLIKTDATGNIQWQKDLGGSQNDSAYKIIKTNDGGYMVACNTYSNDGQITTINHGLIDIWLVKLDNSGNILWSKTYGCADYDGVSGIVQTTDGGYVFAGNSTENNGDVTGNHGMNDLWVVRIDVTGTIIWQKSYGGTEYDFANDIKSTNDGGFILCGGTSSTDFDVTSNHGSFDAWVLKINSSGNLIWQKTYGGTLHDEAYSVLQTDDGGYIIAGQAVSANGDVSDHHGQIDCWVVKLTSTGTISWKKSYGGLLSDSAIEIIKSGDGGYVVAGGAGSTDGFFAANHGLGDAYIYKINAVGTIVWQKLLGGTSYDYFTSIEATPDGGYIACGTSASDNGDAAPGHGLEDFWVVKLGPENLETSGFTQNQLMIYPNPAKNQLNLYFSDTVTIDKITVTDISGKIILSQQENYDQIEIENLRAGIYFIQAFSGNKTFQTKFIKQ